MNTFTQRHLISERYLQLSRAFMQALEGNGDTGHLEALRNEMKEIEQQLCQLKEMEERSEASSNRIGNAASTTFSDRSKDQNNNAKVA